MKDVIRVIAARRDGDATETRRAAASGPRPDPEEVPCPPPDPAKIRSLHQRVIADLAAVAGAPLMLLGIRLGFYSSMAALGAVTPRSLAAAAGADSRCTLEWLASQAAAGYVTHDAESGRFYLTPEQAAIFADRDGAASLAAAFRMLSSLFSDQAQLLETVRSGEGISWESRNSDLHVEIEELTRPVYAAHLIQDWIPALEGVERRLRAGATVAVVGCRRGASALLLAQAYPKSTFRGFDSLAPSIAAAWDAARAQGARNVRFEVASPREFPGRAYDLVTCLDSFHYLGDPVGAATRIREALAEDGVWMLVEPIAGRSLEENLSPLGRLLYALSAQASVPAAQSEGRGPVLGAQAGADRLRDVARAGGFSRFRRATESPFHMVLEVLR